MKEIYDWVPWFRRLAEKIAKGGETYLIEKAKLVAWGGNPPLLQYRDEGIDPFSFFYFLASKARHEQPRKRVYNSVSSVFEMESLPPDAGIDDYYIFPTPQSNANLLFHERENFTPDLLWRLFRAVQDNTKIDPDDFKNALETKYTGVPKLTQTLFLINPEYFLPMDDTTCHLSEALGLPAWSKIKKEIENGGYEKYQSRLKEFKDAFPGCQPYEINMFLDRQKSKKIIKTNSNFFHISTMVDGDKKDDYWDDFKKNNWVYTNPDHDGYDATWSDCKPGDIILVRTGRKKGRAIGIVEKNNYDESERLNENSRILHVLWINKLERGLSKDTRQDGFEKIKKPTWQTYLAFEETKSYKPSFDLINSLTENSIQNGGPEPDIGDQPVETDTMEHLYPLNQILYGPPGTGKTWNTVNRAVAIIDGKSGNDLEEEISKINEGESLNDLERKKIKERFDELKKNGQIEIVTFHQNFTYEDFIEGIKPVLDDDGNGKIEYELSRGIFRDIVERAKKNRMQWDIDELLQDFAMSIEAKLESKEKINLFSSNDRSGAMIGGIRWKDGNFQSVLLGGTVKSQLTLSGKGITRYYDDFYKGKITKQEDIKGKEGNQHGLAKYYFPLFQKIKQFHDEWQQEESIPVEKQNYVLIIDEINRGNIAKIFADLITLIEPSKRIGSKQDETTVTLPYSQDSFGIPDNLYIIGTMNTADRSIALLDTALRRRFEFIEMMPEPYHASISTDIEGVNCQKLLVAMNDRIRFLLDREHQIGHTYFMDVDDMESLAATFKNRIIPLLQEYFYDNWEKIDLVLNGNGFIEDKSEELRKDILEKLPENKNALGDLIDEERKIYELLPFDREEWQNPESYRASYEKG